MGWKSINGNRYYYKPYRSGGRVRTDYFGAGLAAVVVAELDKEDKEERAADRLIDTLAEHGENAVAENVVAAEDVAEHGENAVADDAAKKTEMLKAVFDLPRANVKPFDSVQSRQLFMSLLNQAVGKNAKEELRYRVFKEMSEYAENLAGPSPTPIELTLAEAAATAWFSLRSYEREFAAASNSRKGMSLHQGRYHLFKIDRAYSCLMRTLKTLATVRKSAVPSVHVNIARKQVDQQVIAG